MGYRGNFIAHLPGHILYLTTAIFLALVAFNTPLLKSFYFLRATYTVGQNSGEVSFGTLGYCVLRTGGEVCTGPKIGYELDLNSIFGIDGSEGNLFKIPSAIGKYLTYVLILHIVALVSCAAAIIFRLLDTVDNVSLLCCPALLSWFTSACTLAAFVIDLAMFYIAKARIDSVDGASAKIGVSVWFTLVAWVLPVFASCFCGINQVENRRSPKAPRPDEQAYPQNAGGYARVPGPPLHTYPEREVSVPLDPDADNKKSDDSHTGMSNNHNLGYSSQDQHYQPRRNPSSNYGHGTYPPRDPYSTGYYREYGDGHENDAQGGDLGAGTGMGMGTYAGVGAGAAAVGAGAAAGGVAAGYGQRTPSAQGHGYGYEGYQSPPPGSQPLQQQGYAGYGQGQYAAQPEYGQQPQQQQGYDAANPYANNSYAQPMPMPVARALSPQSSGTGGRVDPFQNPDYMHDQIPYPQQSSHLQQPPTAGYSGQDAYGGYETPNTARPMDPPPTNYGQTSYPPTGVVAPSPRGVNTQMQDGHPQFPLDGPVSPVRGDAQMYDTPPSYAVAADANPTHGQAARRTGSMDKSGGYFR